MSKSNPKPFVIRGFDPSIEAQFHVNSDVMAQFPTFVEKSVIEQPATIITMLTKLAHMTALKFTDAQIGTFKPALDLAAQSTSGIVTSDAPSELAIIDLRIITDAVSSSDLRQYRTGIRRVLKAWAEKSSVTKARGFRLSAVKTPKIGKDQYTAGHPVTIKTQIILGSTLFYNQNRLATGFNANPDLVREDLANLQADLRGVLGSTMLEMRYTHSTIGAGTL